MGTRLGTRLGTTLGTDLGSDLGGGASIATTMDGIRMTPTTGHVRTVAATGGIAGTGTGFFVASLFRLRVQTGTLLPIVNRQDGLSGWYVVQNGTNSIQARCYNGVGAGVSATSYTVSAGDVGKLMGAVLVHTGTHVRFYVNRVEVGSGVAITGFTATTGRTYAGLFASASTVPANTPDNFGVGGAHGVPSLANIQAWFDACKLGLAFSDMPSVPMTWRCRLDRLGTIDDAAGTDDMQTTGASAPTVVNTGTITWGW